MTTRLRPNPLNLFDIRSLKFPPGHFEYINLPMKYNIEDTLSKWITKNLKGRYYIGKTSHIDNENKVTLGIKVGFEEPKELSFFTLACPYLKYK